MLVSSIQVNTKRAIKLPSRHCLSGIIMKFFTSKTTLALFQTRHLQSRHHKNIFMTGTPLKEHSPRFPNSLKHSLNGLNKQQSYYSVTALHSKLSGSTNGRNRNDNDDLIVDVSVPNEGQLVLSDIIQESNTKYQHSSSMIEDIEAVPINNILGYIEHDPHEESIHIDVKKSTLKDTNASGNLSMEKLYNLAVKKNLPKRKPISMHSFLSSMSAMAAIMVLLPTFAPCIDEFGLPQIFNYNAEVSVQMLWQCQLCAVLQLISSVLGMFRLPKNSPSVRNIGFMMTATAVVQTNFVILSSLNGTEVYLFDAFSTVGRMFLITINTVCLMSFIDNVSSVIGDKDMQGWETVPGFNNRIAAMSMTLPGFFGCLTGNAYLPLLGDKAVFEQFALPFYTAFPGVQTIGYCALCFALGISALLATLQFEKKMSNTLASVLVIGVLVLTNFDSAKFAYLIVAFPEKFPDVVLASSEYTHNLQTIWQTNEFLASCIVFAIVHGMYKLWSISSPKN
mmetsp:Transcript_6376/g.8509  ORF Transcript_6376/g.8509 Transcript_6376/m.8509 type:complete len:507 (-) Transcript_6376:627-2147(-)